MANYYTSLSFIFSLPSKEAQAYALDLIERVRSASDAQETEPKNIPSELWPHIDEWFFSCEKQDDTGLWINSSDGGLDAIIAFVQHMLEKYDPEGVVAFEWANDCSKPRVDAFGGGAAVVTAKDCKCINTSTWVEEQVGLLKGKTPKKGLGEDAGAI